MTAKEYLKQVRRLRTRIRAVESIMNSIDYALYSVKGIDPSSEKVSGHRNTDISDKIIEAEQKKEKLDKEREALKDALDDAEKRIESMADATHRAILLDIYIYGRKRRSVMADLGMTSATLARRKREAIAEFGEENSKFLESIVYIG